MIMMKRLFVVSLAFVILALIGKSVVAEDLFDLGETALTLYVNDQHIISVNGPKRIAIGNPNVIDVVNVTEKDMTIIGKGKGETSLNWWDNFGQHTLTVKVYQENMTLVKKRIDNLLRDIGFSNISTKALDSEGKVLLRGEVKTEEDKNKLMTALGELKDKTLDFINVRGEESSVEIEVQVLELSKDAVKTLGFDLPSAINFTELSGPTSTAATGLSALFHVSDWTRSAFSFKLDLLLQSGQARILSRPRLVCRSGKSANLLIGGEVPVFNTEVASGGGEGTNVDYKEYGIKLNIEPTVVDDDKVDIKLDVEVSELQSAETIGDPSAPTAKAYPLTKRTISTEVSLRDNATLSIGGLIKEKTDEDIKKFPWLADVPVLGAFFRHKSVSRGGGAGQRGNTELFITLTPHIINMRSTKAKKIVLPQGESSQKEEIFKFYEKKNIPDELKDYIYTIQKRILSNISYPKMLRNTGWEGSLILSLKISSTGELKDVSVVRSSGYKIFDEEALEVVRKLSYPPFPARVHLKEVGIEVPIVYRSGK